MNKGMTMTDETITIRTEAELDIALMFCGLRLKFMQEGIYSFWEVSGPSAVIDELVDAIVGSYPSDAWLRAHGH